MKNFIQPGEVVELVAPYTVVSGAGTLVGAIFGVAKSDVTSGNVGEYATRGVYTLAKTTGAAWTQGELLYWDDSGKKCTVTSSGNHLIGTAIAAASSGAAVGNVLLNGNAVAAS